MITDTENVLTVVCIYNRIVKSSQQRCLFLFCFFCYNTGSCVCVLYGAREKFYRLYRIVQIVQKMLKVGFLYTLKMCLCYYIYFCDLNPTAAGLIHNVQFWQFSFQSQQLHIVDQFPFHFRFCITGSIHVRRIICDQLL